MQIHKIVAKTAVEGPGIRFCLWVQGCSRHCEGCFNPETWNPLGGYEISVESMLEKIYPVKGIEGITLLGGEPFEQASELARLCHAVRKKGLSVVAFSGFTLDELRGGREEGTARLLAEIDLLMDGPFVKQKQDFSRPWIGSKNQSYCFLTERYSMEDVKNAHQGIEFRMDKSGGIEINGMPDLTMQDWLMSIK